MLGLIIAGFMIMIIGVTLLPLIAQQTFLAQNDSNVTGASDVLLGLNTLFFALVVCVSGLGVAVAGLRNSGMI